MVAETTLSRLIRQRKDELGMTYRDVCKKAEQAGHQLSVGTLHNLVTQPTLRGTVKAKTLHAVAAGLDYPYDVLAEAAAELFGYKREETMVSLANSGQVKIVAAVMDELDEDGRARLVRIAEELHRRQQADKS